MRIFYVLFFFFLCQKFTYAKNIYELTAMGLAIPVLVDQYFDNSLSEKGLSHKKMRVLNKFYVDELRKDFSVNINTKSDLIYYLTVTDKLNFNRNKY